MHYYYIIVVDLLLIIMIYITLSRIVASLLYTPWMSPQKTVHKVLKSLQLIRTPNETEESVPISEVLSFVWVTLLAITVLLEANMSFLTRFRISGVSLELSNASGKYVLLYRNFYLCLSYSVLCTFNVGELKL